MTNESEIGQNDFLQLAGIYELLGHIWLHEISRERLVALSEPGLRNAIENLGCVVPTDTTEDTIQKLADDFDQLFVAPEHHEPPVQSCWPHHESPESPAQSAAEYYEQLPDFIAPESVTDHLGVQLLFMAELFQEASDGQDDSELEDLTLGFFADHLCWTEQFLTSVEKHARTEFYKGIARITNNVLNDDGS